MHDFPFETSILNWDFPASHVGLPEGTPMFGTVHVSNQIGITLGIPVLIPTLRSMNYDIVDDISPLYP